MWHTNAGERVLEGAEARLFSEALLDLASNVKVFEDDYEVGLNVFDRLTHGQKVYLLSVIAAGLLKADEPVRKLTAPVEGAIAAVFAHIKDSVAVEIDMPEIGNNWRELILAARRQHGAEELLDLDCQDLTEWGFEIDELSELILWDADYESEDLYLDKPPEHAQAIKYLMRISDEYFMEIPDDLKPEEIEAAMAEIKRVCQSVCG